MSNDTSTKSPRGVLFSDFSQLTFIPKDDAESKWYSPEEKQSNREALIQETRHMLKEISSTSSDAITSEQLSACIGIELFVTQGLATHVEKQRRVHIQAVLDEQRLQKEYGVCEPEKLCDVSKMTSKWSRHRARKLAKLVRM